MATKTKKTIRVLDLIEDVNYRNRVSTCDSKVREGWNSFVEGFLARCDAYAGFTFFDEHGDGDHTRRQYIVHHKLIRKAIT